MNADKYYIIGCIIMGLLGFASAIFTKYAPIHAIGRKTWYKVKKEYEKEYIRNEVIRNIVSGCYFFIIALVIYLNIFSKYVWGIAIVCGILLSCFFEKRNKNFFRNTAK